MVKLYTTYGNYIVDVVSRADYKTAIKGTEVVRGDIIMPITSTTKEAQIGKASAILMDESIYLGGDAIALKHDQEPGYLVHLLNSQWFEPLKMRERTGTTVSHLSPKGIAKIKIPVPPLEVQKEIVRVLDSFTELEAELEARNKQYEYYRNNLMTFDENTSGVQWKTLESVCESVSAGGDLPNNYMKGNAQPTKEFPYPIYSNGTEQNALYGYSDSYKIDKKAVTISARGTIGYHAVRGEKFTPIVRLITLIPNTKIITIKFLNYALDITEIGHSGGSIPQLTVPNVKKINIPVPTLAVQERIVSILDKFEKLTNDIEVEIGRASCRERV